jgi:hypothetical protein
MPGHAVRHVRQRPNIDIGRGLVGAADSGSAAVESSTDQRSVAGGGSIATGLTVGFFANFATMWVPLFMELDQESDAWAHASIGANILMLFAGAVLAIVVRDSRRTYMGFTIGVLATGTLLYMFLISLVAGVGS